MLYVHKRVSMQASKATDVASFSHSHIICKNQESSGKEPVQLLSSKSTHCTHNELVTAQVTPFAPYTLGAAA